MNDPNHGIFNAAPGNVSKKDIHSLFYSGNSTKLFAYFEPWFCMAPGSTATGQGTNCTSHIQVGYNSNDSATVHSQIDDMKSRGFDGLIMDSYGPNLNFYNSVSQKIRDDLNARCAAEPCAFSFALMEDEGSYIWTSCPRNGGGIDQTACITNAIESDLDYMNANYFTAASYLKVDKITKQSSASGRPVVFYFICEECYTNPAPNWGQIWGNVRAHVQPYAHGNGLFIFRNAPGFTHAEADGAFAWVNWYGTDPYGLVYLDNFYDTSVVSGNRTLLTWGGGWKGFNDVQAAWAPSPSRYMDQQCGQTWLQTMKEMTHNNDYGTAYQLPYLGAVTWNDYEEGTEIETGIDNCLNLSATVTGNTLSWTPSFSSPQGSEATVDSYVVFDSTDNQNLTTKATIAPGVHSIDLSTLNLSPGSHTLYVKAVGKASILNKISAGVSYTPPQVPSASVSPTSMTFSTRLVGNTSSAKVATLTNASSSALAISSISTAGDFTQTNNCGASLAAGSNCSIYVSFRPSGIGTRAGMLTVKNNAPNSPQTVSLSGTGTVVSLSPTSLNFGVQTVGTTSAAKSVTVANKGSSTLNITSITTAGDYSQANHCPAQLAAAASCVINVRFKPTRTGTRSGSLYIYDNGGASPQRVSLTGKGQ